jgi:hypothetical protein
MAYGRYQRRCDNSGRRNKPDESEVVKNAA